MRSTSLLCKILPTNLGTYIHTYTFINPRSHVTIQDAKTVSGEIEKEAKKKKKTKLNYLQRINIYIALQYCLKDD